MNKNIAILLITGIIIITSGCAPIEDWVETIMSDTTKVKTNEEGQVTKQPEEEQVNAQPKYQKAEDWELGGDARFDRTDSFDNEPGSIKLFKTADSWQGVDKATLKHKITVKPGSYYEFTFNIKSETWPPPSITVFGEYYSNKKRLFNEEGSYYSNSKVGTWENNKLYIQIPNDADIQYFVPKIYMLPKHGLDSEIWIDNIEFREINISENKNSNNIKNFNGSLTRVDKYGNIEIYRDNKWKPFFMFGIYTDNNRSDWKIYSKQGFNTNMWAAAADNIKKGKEAGLYSNMQIGSYVSDADWLPKEDSEKIQHLTRTINKIKNENLMNEVVFYYIDNEFYKITDQLINVTNTVKSLDIDKNGQRMHPIYMLNGAFGIARKYNDISDITGTYVAFDRTDRQIVQNFTGLQINENQLQPAVIAQINRGVGLNLRPILFGAIAKGAKGMGFWRDGGSGIDIEKALWWNDFPDMVREIEHMIPLIRESHFTDWTVSCDNNNLLYGSRMYNNKGHLIISNPTASRIQANFTIIGLSYRIGLVKDYFNNGIAGDINGNTITVTLNPYGTKVIRLD